VPAASGTPDDGRWRTVLAILRTSMAVMWIVTGVVSIWFYPVQDSFDLLARTGVPPILQPLALYGAGALDILLGVLCFVPYRRRLVWLAQIALILFYTVVITLRLPEFWMHPYGPILKNLPILAALLVLYVAEPRLRDFRLRRSSPGHAASSPPASQETR